MTSASVLQFAVSPELFIPLTMPSDLAKKKAAKKKEAAKARQRPKKAEEGNGEAEKPETQENGLSEVNGESGSLNDIPERDVPCCGLCFC